MNQHTGLYYCKKCGTFYLRQCKCDNERQGQQSNINIFFESYPEKVTKQGALVQVYELQRTQPQPLHGNFLRMVLTKKNINV